MTGDPFAHLHDEHYAEGFAAGRVGAAELVAMGGRRRIPLADGWRLTPDLYDEGLRQKWYLHTPDDPRNWTLPRDYDAGGAESVTVPSCWNMLKPEWRHFEGSMWYAREFAWPPMLHGERLALRVGAANYQARVFLNGCFLARHLGGSTPFFADLTPALRPGANRLMIQVENRRSRRPRADAPYGLVQLRRAVSRGGAGAAAAGVHPARVGGAGAGRQPRAHPLRACPFRAGGRRGGGGGPGAGARRQGADRGRPGRGGGGRAAGVLVAGVARLSTTWCSAAAPTACGSASAFARSVPTAGACC